MTNTMVLHNDVSKAYLYQPPRKAEEWNRYAHSLIKMMQHCLSVLYENLEEFSEPSKDATSPDGATVSDIAETFAKHCQCLDLLLSTPTNWLVKLPMCSVVNVLVRCLKVTSAEIKVKPSLSELADVLPSLHQSAHASLTCLIICCGSNILSQSRLIIDACLQSLAGTKCLKGDSKCATRAGAFKVFCLLVAKFGWSRYLQSQSCLLIQELMSDICILTTSKMDSTVNVTKQKQEVELIAQRKAKKKKGKKHKGDSYSDLPLPIEDGKKNVQPEFLNGKATQQALNLSRLIIQRAEFSQIQVLVRSVLDTSKILQREGSFDCSPYKLEECRKDLYSTVFACVTMKLGLDCNRKDIISHFQASNLALSLLNRASHSETSNIQKMCSQYLVFFSNTGNMNRPIVRRIMPDEQRTTKDVLELEREAERLGEEKSNLWKQLVDAQLELETQRKEVKRLLQETALAKSVEPNESKYSNNSYNTQNNHLDYTYVASPENDEEISPKDEENVSALKETDSQKNDGMAVKNREEKAITTIDIVSKCITKPAMNSASENGCPSRPLSIKGEKKRTLVDEEDEELSNKRAKTDTSKATDSDDIDAMISDFVDSAPDHN